MQTLDERRMADARLRPFDSRAGFRMAAFGTVVSVAFIGLVLAVAFILTTRMDMMSMSVDFRVFWGAAKLALAGEPLAAHDLARLGQAHGTDPAYLPWLYPPGFLLFVTPFGLLGFLPAFILWMLISYAAVALAMRPFVADIRPLWVLVVLSPAYLPSTMLGQTSLLWMAALIWALAALRDQRWVLAGVLIGCLTLKPQLGLMIPFALLGMGAWRTILAAMVTSPILLVVPTLIYGVEYWPLLQAGLAEHSERMMFSFASIKLMISPLYTFCFYGVPADLALILQWIITGILPFVVIWFWWSKRASFDIKAAVLLISILLTAPYLWYYEGAMLAAVALFLVRGGVLDTRPLHLIMLFLLWLGCGLQAINYVYDSLHEGWLGAAYISPLLVLCLGMCARRVLGRRHSALVAG